MNKKDEEEVSRSDIMILIRNIPSGVKVGLKDDPLTSMNSDQIMDQIDAKTSIGKKYYLQLALAVQKLKKNKEWEKIKKNTEGGTLVI